LLGGLYPDKGAYRTNTGVDVKMVEKPKEEKPKEKKEEIWTVSDVPTQTAPMVVNTETKEAYPIEEALAKILNDLEALKKLLD